MDFKTTYRKREVKVDYSFATEPYESLDGVTITYDDGEQIDYDGLTSREWIDIHDELVADLQSRAPDPMDDGDYAYDNWKDRQMEKKLEWD